VSMTPGPVAAVHGTSSPVDADVLARLRRLHLVARRLTDEMIQGHQRSRRTGQALEFADYREYQPGMDLRFIDWKVAGRSERLVVKRFEAETEVACTIVLDLSGDLGTGATAAGGFPDLDRSKAGFAIQLAATLAWWFHRQGEPVGLEIVAGQAVHTSMPPKGGASYARQILRSLAGARTGGIARLGDALRKVGGRTRRRSLVVLISDGMEEPEAWLPALAAFGHRRTDLRFVHLYDEAEMRLDLGEAPVAASTPARSPWRGWWFGAAGATSAATFAAASIAGVPALAAAGGAAALGGLALLALRATGGVPDSPDVIVEDPEHGGEMTVDAEALRAAFSPIVRDYFAEVGGAVTGAGAMYLPFATSTPLDRVARAAILGVGRGQTPGSAP
jgi:uncharacterized protein (DUF58 family)